MLAMGLNDDLDFAYDDLSAGRGNRGPTLMTHNLQADRGPISYSNQNLRWD